MSTILVYSDHEQLALELITAARSIGSCVYAVTINDENMALNFAKIGVKVLALKSEKLSVADTAAMASALEQAVRKSRASTVLLSSNRRLREITGRLAQKIGGACLTNVNSMVRVGENLICTRYSMGGATVSITEISKNNSVIALSANAFQPATGTNGGCIEDFKVEVQPTVNLVETNPKENDSVDIAASEVLVAVGRGFRACQDVQMAEQLANIVGGSLGCSKPVASDRKWMPEDRVIGLSGKICKPRLAVLLGVSGQVQFAVGVRDAKTIIAITDDENAPVISLADYLLVGDLYQVMPVLNQLL